MSTVSERIAQWVENTSFETIPQSLIYIVKRSMLDYIGVTLAGSRELAAKSIDLYLLESKNNPESSVIGLGYKTSCHEAAFANGIIGHCLDYDDLIHPVPGGGGPHITAAIFPSILAIAEKWNKSGKDIIAAYIIGCEVAYRVGRAIEPAHYNLGWHNTETEGIFGATVAVSKLLNLNQEQMVYALGIAGSDASGLRENFGTMTKPFHAGQSNAKAIRAAMLAKNGFTSSNTIFEGRYGYFHVLCKDINLEELTTKLGQPFCLEEIQLKLYPCCGGTQCSIDATLELVNQYDIKADDVEEVVVKCVPLVSSVLVYTNPQTYLEGKFSIQFPLALAMRDRKVTLQQFNQSTIKDPEIVSLMKKVKLVTTPELAPKNYEGEPVIVEIKLKSNRLLSQKVVFHSGTKENPLTDEQLFEKYRSCAQKVLSEAKIAESREYIMNMEKLDRIDRLLDIISGK